MRQKVFVGKHRKKSEFWESVRLVVERGESPVVLFQPEQRVKIPRFPEGAKPNIPEETFFQHYLSNFSNARFKHPTCKRKGCFKFLKMNDILVCSNFCRNELAHECRKILILIEKNWVVSIPKVKTKYEEPTI